MSDPPDIGVTMAQADDTGGAAFGDQNGGLARAGARTGKRRGSSGLEQEGRAMEDWKLPWGGGCMCGQIRFRVTKAPLLAMACHCTGCQRLTASAYSLSLALPSDGFTITQGELVLGGLHGIHEQLYCPRCKNWVCTRPHGLDWLVNIRATMLDEHRWYKPYVEVFTSEKLPWAATSAVHSFGTQPDLDGYAPLIEAFAREGARPS